MEKIQLKTIKKILKDHLPKKKGEEIGDLAEGLHKWLHTNKNYKKVEKIVKDGCSKQKGGGKTRKRKRKRKKRTRSRRGGNGDEEWWDHAAFTVMAVMIGFGMYLLFEFFPPNDPCRRSRQQTNEVTDEETMAPASSGDTEEKRPEE